MSDRDRAEIGEVLKESPMAATPSEPLDVGDRAPHFTLRRTFQESVDLDDLLEHGPVVVAFYVFDFGDV
jgi:hypothetical protein